uniref:Virion related protein n=1 Tax=Hot spring virus BHS2 TaxID=2024352 RepID=A0A2U7NSU4_9VIRU|nr:virion related protein [Hot spring virus BHS2]
MIPEPQYPEDATEEIPLEQGIGELDPLSSLFATPNGAIAIPEEKREEFIGILRRNIDAARAAKEELDARVKVWRASAMCTRREAPYQGAPNVRTPTTRGRLDAVRAQIRGSLEIDPFFSATPLSEDGARAAPAFEAALEQELRTSQSRRHLLLAADESVEVGTGIIKLTVREVARGNTTDYRIVARSVPLERFFVYPPGTDELEYVSTYELFHLPVHVIRQYANAGKYDPDAIEKIEKYYSTRDTPAQELMGTTNATDPYTEERPIELYECWLHYEDKLWTAIFHYDSQTLLAARENPYPLNHPPYFPIRPLPKTGHFFGDAMAIVLEAFQDINDAAFNSLLAWAQFALSPALIIYDDELYREMQNKKWEPGARFRAFTRDKAFDVLATASQPMAIDLLRVTDQMAEIATFSNMQIPGLPTPGRRTAREIDVVASAGMAKLRSMFLNVREDMNAIAEAYWRLYVYYRVESQGVLDVYSGFKKLSIATREINVQSVDPQTGAPVTLFIPSAYREDVRWECSGGDTQTEKQMRLQNLQLAFQFVFPILPYISQDSRLWNWAKQMLDSLNVPNWRDLIGEPPPTRNDQALAAGVQMQKGIASQPKPGS